MGFRQDGRPRTRNGGWFLGVMLLLAASTAAAGFAGRERHAPAQEAKPETPAPRQADGDIRLLADAAYLPVVLDLFAGARESIDVTMFSCVLAEDARAGHPVRRLLDRLVERSKAGVRVRVVLDHGVPASRRVEGEEVPSAGGAAYLRAAGIEVRWDEDARTTHTKSLVIDGRRCVVGSTNWTASALGKNREQSVLIDSRALATDLTKRFEALWAVAVPVAAGR